MNENGLTASDVALLAGNGGGNGGFGNGNGWEGLIFIFALLALTGGFGRNGGGFGGGNGGGGADVVWPIMMNSGAGMNNLYPWINNSQNISDGFRDQMLNDNITSIRDGVYGISTQLCNGFAGVNAGVANGFAQAEIAANSRQIADMQQMFALQSALQQCCCDNRAATADLKYTVATENCADRTAAMQNTRDLLDNQNRVGQAILDKLCALELDGVKGQLAAAQRENVGLQNQLNMAAFRESQANQNALFAQGMNDEVDALYNRLSNCPVSTIPVYGRQPIFTCQQNHGCGCGCNI